MQAAGQWVIWRIFNFRRGGIQVNIGLFWLWFWVAYILVTLVGIGHTIFNWKVLKMENNKEKVTSMYDILAYAKTVPFHPFYNLVIWPIFAYLYFVQTNTVNVWQTAFFIGASWMIITILFDLFGWVVIRHPWSMTFKEMYLDYQPWITLIYLSIFAGPLIAALFV
jgi:hypothetical protein